jgi:hypothetical protein
VSAAGDGVRADVTFSTGGVDDPAASMRDGLESRITFTLRCYEHRPGLAGLFGDALLVQRTVVRAAFYDFFDRRFVVEQDGQRTSYADEAGFLAAFFTLGDVEILPAATGPRSGDRTDRGAAGSRYVAAELLPAAGAPGSGSRTEAGRGTLRPRYVAARAQYDPVRLSPPLTILTLFGVATRHTTPWVRRDVPQGTLAEARP